jgi:hypothetical protein
MRVKLHLCVGGGDPPREQAHPDDVQIGKAMNCRGEDVPLETVVAEIRETLMGESPQKSFVKDEEYTQHGCSFEDGPGTSS